MWHGLFAEQCHAMQVTALPNCIGGRAALVCVIIAWRWPLTARAKIQPAKVYIDSLNCVAAALAGSSCTIEHGMAQVAPASFSASTTRRNLRATVGDTSGVIGTFRHGKGLACQMLEAGRAEMHRSGAVMQLGEK